MIDMERSRTVPGPLVRPELGRPQLASKRLGLFVGERGRTSTRHKLAALPDAAWRAAYAAVPEIGELLG
jgi:hypothetical protein